MDNHIIDRDFPIEIELHASQENFNEQFGFEVYRRTADLSCPIFEEAWNRLLETGRSPEKIYQMPAFVRSRNSDHHLEDHWELIIVRCLRDANIVAIIPLRKGLHDVSLKFGPVCLFKYKIKVFQILGSVPLLYKNGSRLLNLVLNKLLEHHPDYHALSMQAVPIELKNEFEEVKSLSSHVLNGWRECHTLPLPDSVNEYLQKFSSKKRYNLSRQIRMLSKEAGEACLVRITQPHQVADLIAALLSLPAAQQHATPEQQKELEYSARHGLLLSYLLQCGGKTAALIIGSAGGQVWHVHNIYCDEKLANMSVGTSITHLAVQDVIENLSYKLVDFGYGTPNQEYRSTHVLKKRGHVLLCRTRSLCNVMLVLNGVLGTLDNLLVTQIKNMRKKFHKRQQKFGNS